MSEPTPYSWDWRNVAQDWGPVVAVALASAAGLGLENPWTGSGTALVLTGLATALPLGWRRSHPVPAAVGVGVALGVQTHLVGGSLHFGSFCAVLLAMYSIGRHLADRPTAIGGGLVLGLAVVVAQARELAESPVDIVFPLFYLTATWFVGRGILVLHDQTLRLRELNAALERDRESQARLAVASDRLGLARELHDLIGHTVMLMVVQASAAQETLERDHEATRRSLAAVQEAGRTGLQELRRLVEALRESGDTDHRGPDLGQLSGLTEAFTASGLEVRVHTSGDVEGLPQDVSAAAFRVVQESLTNVRRHSRADLARVDLVVDQGHLAIEVTDEGPARPTTPGGHGLTGMRERVELLGGRLTVAGPGQGFTVSARIPVSVRVP